jgi:hypothetical protein
MRGEGVLTERDPLGPASLSARYKLGTKPRHGPWVVGMTDTKLEQMIDLTLTEFMSELDALTAEDLQQVREHAVVRYFTDRLVTPTERWALFPAAEEYYLAQARMFDRRWKFQCQKTAMA